MKKQKVKVYMDNGETACFTMKVALIQSFFLREAKVTLNREQLKRFLEDYPEEFLPNYKDIDVQKYIK